MVLKVGEGVRVGVPKGRLMLDASIGFLSIFNCNENILVKLSVK